MKKIAIIFPGIGYNVDKPLLYYSKKIMREHEFEIVDVSFEGISKKALSDHTAMVQAFADCSSQTEEQLKGIRFDDYDEICFISKSLGTVAASVYAAKHGLKVRQVYYTPLEQTFSLVEEGNGLVFVGTADPWIDFDRIRSLCISKKLNYRVIDDANHSLETGSVQTDVSRITDIIHEAEDYLVGSPIYDFTVKMRDGSLESLKAFRGKVLLIVNSATGCGFTPQYEALEKLYRDYKKDGFEILDFPCNQFGHQAPGTSDEIHSFCTSRYDVSFTQFAKIDVNGSGETELYGYLKSKQGFGGFLRNSKDSLYMEKVVSQADPDYLHNSDIKWNFTKFLVNRFGQVIRRFEPDAGTEIVRQAVEKELKRT